VTILGSMSIAIGYPLLVQMVEDALKKEELDGLHCRNEEWRVQPRAKAA
jgi:hypothetical protein